MLSVICTRYYGQSVVAIIVQYFNRLWCNDIVFRHNICVPCSLFIIVDQIHLITDLDLVKVIEYLSIDCTVMSGNAIVAMPERTSPLKMSCRYLKCFGICSLKYRNFYLQRWDFKIDIIIQQSFEVYLNLLRYTSLLIFRYANRERIKTPQISNRIPKIRNTFLFIILFLQIGVPLGTQHSYG